MAGDFKKAKGYSRINFLSKSEKDKRATSTAKAATMADGKTRTVKLKRGGEIKYTPVTKTMPLGKDVKTGDANITKATVTQAPSKSTYKEDTAVTGKKEYGPEGKGTNKEMQGLLSDARSKGREITAPNKKGLRFRAGTRVTEMGDTKVTQGQGSVKAPTMTTRSIAVSAKKQPPTPKERGDVQKTVSTPAGSWVGKSTVKRGQNKYKVKIKGGMKKK